MKSKAITVTASPADQPASLLLQLRSTVSRAAFRIIPEHLILTCQDTTALLSKSFDTDLPIAERTQVRLHLTFCSACKRYSKQLQFLHDVLHDEPLERPTLREKARQRLQEEIISAM